MTGGRTLLAVLCVAACCALGGFAAAAVRAGTGGGTDVRGEPVAEVLVSADGRTLSASGSGPCLPAGALFAHEGRGSVTVTLAKVPRTGACTSGIETRTWSVTLHSPLGARQVIDSVDGRGVLVFDERELLRPTALPAGYVHVYDAAMYADGDGSAGSDWDASCSQLFKDDGGDLLWIVQSHGRHWPAGWGPDMPLIAVRHSLARYRPGMLAWQENGRSFLIVSAPVFGEPLSTPRLAAVARSLQPG